MLKRSLVQLLLCTGSRLCEHWHCALVGNAGNLHFSNIEMSDDRAGRPYVCIVINHVLRSLVQGDDQKIEPVPRPGTASAWFRCPTYDQWWGRPVLFRPLQVLDHCRFKGSTLICGTELFNLSFILLYLCTLSFVWQWVLKTFVFGKMLNEIYLDGMRNQAVVVYSRKWSCCAN